MARNIITGIDAGSSTIRVIVAEEKKDGGLNILSASQKPSDGIKKGFVSDIENATKSISLALHSAEKTSGVSIKNSVVAVNGIGLGSIKSKGMVMISRADGEVTDNDVKRVVEQSEANLPNISNRRIIHSIPLYFKIDNNLVWGRPAGMTGSKLETETLFITCLNQHISNLIKCVEGAGVVVDDIIASPLAMANALLTKNQKEVGCVLVNIGSTTVSVIVFEEGLPISLEVFLIGSNYITSDIALGFQIPLEEAEKMKINYGTENPPPKRKLEDIIEARMDDIFELIENHLKKIGRQEMLPGGIILTGGGSSLFSLEDIAKSSLHLPAKIGSYATTINNSSRNITANTNSTKEMIFNDPAWSTALGLCLMSTTESSTELSNSTISARGIFSNMGRWFKNLMP